LFISYWNQNVRLPIEQSVNSVLLDINMRFELHLKSAILHCTHLIALTNVLEFFIITIAKIILSRQIYIFITKFNVIYLYITTTLYYFIEDYNSI